MWQQELVVSWMMPRQTDKAPDNTNFLVWLAADGLDQELELPILLMGHRLTFHPLDQTV